MIFGEGHPGHYLPIHQTIDLHKIVTPTVTARFLMHHYDVGGAILAKMFGSNVPETRIPVRDVLIQHLLEDYGQVPCFEDWLASFHQPHPMSKVESISSEEVAAYVKKALPNINLELVDLLGWINQIRNITSLRPFASADAILQDPNRFCIFGHQTGLELLKRILKPSTELESDVITVIAHRLLGSPFKGFFLSTITAWEENINAAKWMLRPDVRMEVDEVKSKLQEIRRFTDKSVILGVTDRKEPHGPQKMKWTPVEKPSFERHGGCGGGGEGINMVLD